MADIELVIKIPEEQYNAIKSDLLYNTFSAEMKIWGLGSIRNGTPLPKGHGRLIDADRLETHFVGTDQGTDLEVYLKPTIVDALTILEADKEENK